MICKKCGKEIKDTAKFCGYCGSANKPIVGEQPPEISENVNYTPSWMKQEVITTTSTISAKQNTDIKTEISKNTRLFALPIIYLVWQIIRIFLNIHFMYYGHDIYISYMNIAAIVGYSLYGAVSGGLVVAINNCSPKFKWIYLTPYAVVCGYFIISNFNYMGSVVRSVFEFLEIIISMFIIMRLQNAQFCKDYSIIKSTIIVAAISTGAGVLVFRFVYYLLIGIVFGGYVSFTWWNIIASGISIIGAVIGAAFSFDSESKKQNSTQR